MVGGACTARELPRAKEAGTHRHLHRGLREYEAPQDSVTGLGRPEAEAQAAESRLWREAACFKASNCMNARSFNIRETVTEVEGRSPQSREGPTRSLSMIFAGLHGDSTQERKLFSTTGAGSAGYLHGRSGACSSFPEQISPKIQHGSGPWKPKAASPRNRGKAQ